MPAGEANAALRRDGIRELVLWLETMTGGSGPCPFEREIAQHFRIVPQTAGIRLRQAAELGMIRLSVPPSRRMQRRVEILRTELPALPKRTAKPAAAPRPPVAAPVVPPSAVAAVPALRPRPDTAAFRYWLANAEKGSRYTYFVGHLAEERGKPVGGRDTAGLARAAQVTEAQAAGVVALTMVRHGEVFAYIAIRTAQRVRA